MDLILLWHLHQPYYAFPGETSFQLPWVRLHAAKSYLDMAEALKARPEVKVVANFSGGLLEQLARYVDDGWRDRHWGLTMTPARDLSEHDYRFVVRHFFSLNWKEVLGRYPRYVELLDRRGRGNDASEYARLEPAEVTDLQVLFNLAWCGFTLRREDPRIVALTKKGRGFDEDDKAAVLAAHLDALKRIIPTWRALMEQGQVEVSVSPQYHCILPLVVDSDSARRALPDHPMPTRFRHPEDATRQMVLGLDTAERLLGRRPQGMWPSEGSVSPELLPLAAQAGLKWLASDEHVLLRSEREGMPSRAQIYQPWATSDGTLSLFFRDHEISDLVGFSYARLPAPQAVADFARRLAHLRNELQHASPSACVSVILDGENAWEHYPDDGRDFLLGLYEQLPLVAGVSTTTPSDRLAKGRPTQRIFRLHSGSWINSNFRIWIGTRVKNLAWEQLTRARAFVADRLDGTRPLADQPRAERALLRAEGSDWMWWFGDDFYSNDDPLFDALFRENLKAVYRELGAPYPIELDRPIGGDEVEPQISLPTHLIRPRLDGRLTGYFDWVGAGSYTPSSSAGAMARTQRFIERLRFGYAQDHVFLRVETAATIWPSEESPFVFRLELTVGAQQKQHRVDIPLVRKGALQASLTNRKSDGQGPTSRRLAAVCFSDCLDIGVGFTEVGAEAGDEVELALLLLRDGVELQRLPQAAHLELVLPDETFEGRNWLV